MNFLSKFGIGAGAAVSPSREVTLPIPTNGARPRTPGAAPPAAAGAMAATRSTDSRESNRVSNGLKELLWNLEGLGRGTLLDLGPAWQTTLSFFIERGFRVSSEDILREWKDFLVEEENKLRAAAAGNLPQLVDATPPGRATRFLAENLQYPNSTFDAILLWDLLDYLEPSLAKLVVASLTDLLRAGGVVFAMFHSKKPDGFHRYRVADSNTLQMISSPVLCPAQKIYQNREIQDLFGRYRTMKSFIGRDQLRESLFIK
jgi:hypothetical protein